MIATALALFTLLASPPAAAPADPAPDRIELVDGSVVEGRVVFEDATRIVLRVKSKERTFEHKQVRSVRAQSRSLRELLVKTADGLPAGAPERAELARFATERELAGEAHALWWSVLAMDPEHSDAHRALGHRAVKGGWQCPSERGWQSFKRVRDERAAWDEAWRWNSVHYELRTNVSLEEGPAMLLDLERLRAAFHATFGQELGLRTGDEAMKAEVHGDAEELPEPGDMRPAFYDYGQRVLHVRAVEGLDRTKLFHEGTHQLLHLSGEYGPQAKGVIPAWLHEGLAEYMAAAAAGPPGGARFTPGTRDLAHYAVHARAKDPYDLSRVLSFEASDFMASSRSDLKYAQAYTLVDFLLHGRDGRFRPGFQSFLASAYTGQSSSTAFRAAFAELKAGERELEQEWTAWVRSIGR